MISRFCGTYKWPWHIVLLGAFRSTKSPSPGSNPVISTTPCEQMCPFGSLLAQKMGFNIAQLVDTGRPRRDADAVI